MASLIGNKPNQVPTNGDLGSAAYVDINRFYQSNTSASNRNRIINGAMVIDQRNAGASVTVTTTTGYTLDRWTTAVDASSKFSIQKVADAPSGFTYSMKATSLSAYTPSASEEFRVGTIIEGYNFADAAFGSASAKALTFSFWVKSSLTGTFGVYIANADNSRTYVSTYTVNSANTWEQKTVSVPGDTSGTWLTTTGRGIQLFFELAAGSNYFTATLNTWTSSSGVRTTSSQTQLVATNGATWQVTGVQLEAGSVATPFEHRQYGQELALCQRYCQVIRASAYTKFGTGVVAAGDTAWGIPCVTKTAMRSTPTVSQSNCVLTDASGSYSVVSINNLSSADSICIDAAIGTSSMTVGRACLLGSDGSANGVITATAEL